VGKLAQAISKLKETQFFVQASAGQSFAFLRFSQLVST
jgi:hypothetical protein